MGQQTSHEHPGGHSQEPARILVVDDEEQILGLISHVLQAAGYAVETRADGASAVEALSALNALNAQAFDLVITDLAMPGLSGEAVLRAAKALAPAIPVVIITARASEREEATLRLLGADEILLKPFQMGDLVSIVERLLGPRGQTSSDG
jgi:DNA-binding response OmpR family regulator